MHYTYIYRLSFKIISEIQAKGDYLQYNKRMRNKDIALTVITLFIMVSSVIVSILMAILDGK